MSTDYERYRRQALECQEAAKKATTPQFREDWLRLARDWLEMIPQTERPAEASFAESFAAITKATGTSQDASTASH